MRLIQFTVLVIFFNNITTIVIAQDRSHGGKTVLFGNLHAHSNLSGDFPKHAKKKASPFHAFKYAHEHGLDFLAITDHHKTKGSRLRINPSTFKTNLYDTAMDYNKEHEGEFIAIPAIEWGTISTGNHINLFGIKELPPDKFKDADGNELTINDTDYKNLFTWANNHAEFVQFNHPYSWGDTPKKKRNMIVGNFGEFLYGSSEEFVNVVDPIVKTFSIICTVKGGHLSGKHAHSHDKTHRDVNGKAFRLYKKYLNKGFHISPSANQDTHWKNWGTVTAARTAVWADNVSYDSLMDAFVAGRVYATEDDEMAVVFQVQYQGKKYWMGESVPLNTDEADIEVLVRIWQTKGSDDDGTDEGPYTVSVFSDYDGVENRQASVWTTVSDIPSGELRSIPLQVLAGEYLFIEVKEQNGQDNLIGDGEDIINNETGNGGSDGLRDDLNDSAWTTPIWFIRKS